MAKKHTVWYATSEGDYRYDCLTDWEIEAPLCDIPGLEERNAARYHSYIAQDCAEDYHGNHDGWESSWPLTFILYASEEGPEIARFEVERESEPVFYATRVKP